MKHYPGYEEVIEKLQNASLNKLLEVIDDLYGRGNLQYGDDIEAVRREAMRQVEIDWRDVSNKVV